MMAGISSQAQRAVVRNGRIVSSATTACAIIVGSVGNESTRTWDIMAMAPGLGVVVGLSDLFGLAGCGVAGYDEKEEKKMDHEDDTLPNGRAARLF
jgi:hypothetical protein